MPTNCQPIKLEHWTRKTYLCSRKTKIQSKMKKQTILSSIILLALWACSPQSPRSSSALPMWERKSAPAVVLGRYVDWKTGDKDKYPGFWGNKESLKGGDFPEMTTDSIAHTFTFVWDICYPLRHQFDGWSILLFPGDTIRLDINKSAFAEYEAYKKAIRRQHHHTEVAGTLEEGRPHRRRYLPSTPAHADEGNKKWCKSRILSGSCP